MRLKIDRNCAWPTGQREALQRCSERSGFISITVNAAPRCQRQSRPAIPLLSCRSNERTLWHFQNRSRQSYEHLKVSRQDTPRQSSRAAVRADGEVRGVAVDAVHAGLHVVPRKQRPSRPAPQVGSPDLSPQHVSRRRMRQEINAITAAVEDYYSYLIGRSMRIPSRSQPVLRSTSSFFPSADSLAPSDCNPHKDCTFRYPCPTFRNPGRKCTGSNPACVAQRDVCRRDKRAACVLHALRAYIGTAGCASCLASAAGTAGATGVVCAVQCGMAADTIRNAFSDCNRAF